MQYLVKKYILLPKIILIAMLWDHDKSFEIFFLFPHQLEINRNFLTS